MKALCGLIIAAGLVVIGAVETPRLGASTIPAPAPVTQRVEIGTAVTLSQSTQCVVDPHSCVGIGWEEEPDFIISNSR